MIAFAQTPAHVGYAMSLLEKIKIAILYPLISLLIALAFLYFLWGVFQMISHASSEEARTVGKKHMFFGIIGMVVMLSALALLRITAITVGVPVPAY